MTRPPKSAEERTLQSLRQSGCITKAQMDQCFVLLSATEPCPKCAGSGTDPGSETPCGRCEGTGEQFVIH
jgi:DnaJ-class molecular chaperone